MNKKLVAVIITSLAMTHSLQPLLAMEENEKVVESVIGADNKQVQTARANIYNLRSAEHYKDYVKAYGIDGIKSYTNNGDRYMESDLSYILVASQRGDEGKEKDEHDIPRYSHSLDSYGKYALPGETIRIFVDADQQGTMPVLVVGQGKVRGNSWSRKEYPLVAGMNVITMPDDTHLLPGVLYIKNPATPKEQAYAPRVRIEGGHKYPVYRHGEMAPEAYNRQLEAYCAKVEENPSLYADITELTSENNTIVLTALDSLKGVQDMEKLGVDVSDTMDEWEALWKQLQIYSGYVEGDKNPMHDHYPAKYTSVSTTGSSYAGWSDYGYKGNGFTKDAMPEITSIQSNGSDSNEIRFGIDQKNKEALMGYEVYRDGKLIAYTVDKNKYIDTHVEAGKNYEYSIVAYDKKLNASQKVTKQSLSPTLSVEREITIKVGEHFDEKAYAKAETVLKEDISDAIKVVASDVDTSKVGNYTVTYELTSEQGVIQKTAQVKVVEDYMYLSDVDPVSAQVGWGAFEKDLSPNKKPITLQREGLSATYPKGLGAHAHSELIYDLTKEGLSGYDYFEAYIGIDQEMRNNKNSSVVFEVWVDDKRVYESDVFYGDSEHQAVCIPITGAKELKLIVTDANIQTYWGDYSEWAMARLTKSPMIEEDNNTTDKEETNPDEVGDNIGDTEKPEEGEKPGTGDNSGNGGNQGNGSKPESGNVVSQFEDIKGHWAKNAILFVVERNIFKGISDTKFEPNMNITRGMFVTLLGRVAQIEPSEYKQSSFSDVSNAAYYMPYVEWAKE